MTRPAGAAGLARRLSGRSPAVAALASRAGRRLAARHRVGVVAVVFDHAGRIAVVRHAFRDPRWALPGGWIGAHEQPDVAVARELAEELGVRVRVDAVLDAESHREGVRPRFPTPSALTISYACTITDVEAPVGLSVELREVAWVDASAPPADLTPFDARSVRLALGRSRGAGSPS